MFDSIMKFIQLGDGWVIISALILAIIFNAKAIYEFLENVEKRKIATLTDAVGDKGATGNTKEILQEQLNSHLFRYSTGIYAETRLREEIIKLHEFCSGELTFIHFKRARSMLRVKDGELLVEINKYDIASHYFNYGVAAFFGVLFIALFFLSTMLPEANILGRLGLMAFSLFCLLLTLFAFGQTFPYKSAKMIKEKNEKFILHNQSFKPTPKSGAA